MVPFTRAAVPTGFREPRKIATQVKMRKKKGKCIEWSESFFIYFFHLFPLPPSHRPCRVCWLLRSLSPGKPDSACALVWCRALWGLHREKYNAIHSGCWGKRSLSFFIEARLKQRISHRGNISVEEVPPQDGISTKTKWHEARSVHRTTPFYVRVHCVLYYYDWTPHSAWSHAVLHKTWFLCAQSHMKTYNKVQWGWQGSDIRCYKLRVHCVLCDSSCFADKSSDFLVVVFFTSCCNWQSLKHHEHELLWHIMTDNEC